MKLVAGTPAWDNIAAILVDGVRIVIPVECDIDEGYCIGLVPKVSGLPALGEAGQVVEGKEVDLEYEERRFNGRITVLFGNYPATRN